MRIASLLVLFGLTLGLLGPAPASAQPNAPQPPARGWIVVLRDHAGFAQYQDLRRLAGDGELRRLRGGPTAWAVEFTGGTAPSDAIARLMRNPAVAFVEPDIIYEWQFEPNDTYFPEQSWARTIRLPEAWSIATGHPRSVIAVLDSGVRFDHPDLQGKLLSGYDFFDRDHDASDDYGHGTAVAAIAAARGNDGVGIAGVAMDSLILPVRVGNRDGAPVSNIADAIFYAVDRGATVINLSLGSETPSARLEQAIAYAYERNVVVVAAAGNVPDRASFPASYWQTISVGAATGDGGNVASFSSRISRVDLAAPGENVLTAYWTPESGNTWAWMRGTSHATPMVTGTVAVMRSVNPSLSVEQIRTLLTGSTQATFQSDQLGGGSGLLDASSAVRRALLPSISRVWAPADQPIMAGAATRSWLWGPSAFMVGTEAYVDAEHGRRMVVYYDKARMEINDPYADRDQAWYVTAGLLATELITGRVQLGDDEFDWRAPSSGPVAGDPDDPHGPRYATFTALTDAPAVAEGAIITQTVDRDGNVGSEERLASYGVYGADYIQETGQRVASVFQNYLHSTGLIRQPDGSFVEGRLFEPTYFATGYPITEAYWSRVKVAGVEQDVLIQCFERRCLTYTPGNPAGWRVEMGNVGQHYYRWRFGEPPAVASPDDPGTIALGW